MFYEQLKRVCKEKGVKLTPLIKDLGMSQGNLSRWKSGGKPTIEVVNALSERLDVSVDYLLGNTDDPSRAENKKATPALNEDDLVALFQKIEEKNLPREKKEKLISVIGEIIDGFAE